MSLSFLQLAQPLILMAVSYAAGQLLEKHEGPSQNGTYDKIKTFVNNFVSKISEEKEEEVKNDPKMHELSVRFTLIEQHSLGFLLAYIYKAYYYKMGKYWYASNSPQDLSVLLKKQEKITKLSLACLLDFNNCLDEIEKKFYEIKYPYSTKDIIWFFRSPSQLTEVPNFCEFSECYCLDYFLDNIPQLTQNIVKIKKIAEKYEQFENIEEKMDFFIHKSIIVEIFDWLKKLRKLNERVAHEFDNQPFFEDDWVKRLIALREYEKENGEILLPNSI